MRHLAWVEARQRALDRASVAYSGIEHEQVPDAAVEDACGDLSTNGLERRCHRLLLRDIR